MRHADIMEWFSSSGKVEAVVERQSDISRCRILDFRSNDQGKGYAKQALVELRSEFRNIIAVGVEYDAFEFWKKMGEAGLIDEIQNDALETTWPPKNKKAPRSER